MMLEASSSLPSSKFTASTSAAPENVHIEHLLVCIPYLFLVVLSSINVMFSRKKRVSLQRTIFAFILLLSAVRVLQNLQQGLNFSGLAGVELFLDLLSSLFGFYTYFALVCFWAEQWIVFRHDSDGERVSRRVAFGYWIIITMSGFAVGLFFVIAEATSTGAYGRRIGRLVIRVVLSGLTTIGLTLFGSLLFIAFRYRPYIQGSSSKYLYKIAIISVVCGGCYLLLAISDIIKEVHHKSYYNWSGHHVMFAVFSLMEIIPNGLLLVLLAPLAELRAYTSGPTLSTQAAVESSLLSDESDNTIDGSAFSRWWVNRTSNPRSSMDKNDSGDFNNGETESTSSGLNQHSREDSHEHKPLPNYGS